MKIVKRKADLVNKGDKMSETMAALIIMSTLGAMALGIWLMFYFDKKSMREGKVVR